MQSDHIVVFSHLQWNCSPLPFFEVFLHQPSWRIYIKTILLSTLKNLKFSCVKQAKYSLFAGLFTPGSSNSYGCYHSLIISYESRWIYGIYSSGCYMSMLKNSLIICVLKNFGHHIETLLFLNAAFKTSLADIYFFSFHGSLFFFYKEEGLVFEYV